MVPSTTLKRKQVSLPDSQEIKTNQDAAREQSPLVANHSDSSSEVDNNGQEADGEVARGCVSGVCVHM